jgi:hypothetical protein
MNRELLRLTRQIGIVFAVAGSIIINGCKSDSDSAGPGTGTVSVTGKVIDDAGRAVQSAPIVITGKPATTTDANGSFTITDVPTPYDVTVILSANKTAIMYKGLTRADPTLYFTGASVPVPNSATIGGTISGGAGYPLPVNHTSRTIFVATEEMASTSPSGTTGVYSLATSWNGTSTITGTLHAIQWETNGSGMPLTYKGYGTKTGVAITNGGSFAGQNIALTSATTAVVSGSVTVATGFTLSNKSMALTFNKFGAVHLATDATSAASFSFNVPTIAGASIQVAATAASGSLGTSAMVIKTTTGTTGIAVAVPAAPQHSLPVNAATGVTITTPFSWTPVPGGVYIIRYDGPAGEPDLYVVTATPSATIPDLSAQGLGLGASKTYSWSVYSFGPFADINASAGGDGLMAVTNEGWRSISLTRTFVTAP